MLDFEGPLRSLEESLRMKEGVLSVIVLALVAVEGGRFFCECMG